MPSRDLAKSQTIKAVTKAVLQSLDVDVPNKNSKFQRLMAGSKWFNPVTTPAGDEVGATVNPVGTLTAIGGSSTTGYTEFHTDDYPNDGQLFKIFGGYKGARDDGYPLQGWRAVANTQADGTRRYDSGRVAFMTDAPTFDIWGPLSTSAGIRVLVDGRYISRTPILSSQTGGGYYNWFHVVLPNSGLPRRYHRIDVEFNYQEGSFRGIALPSGYLPQPIDQSNIYRIALYGDSLGEGTGTAFAHDSFGAIAGYLLGGIDVDVVLMSIGGTGFVNPGPVNTTAIQHIVDLSGQHYDELWVAMGINDSGNQSQLMPAALAFFEQARSLLPTVPIMVLGIARDDSITAQGSEAQIGAAFTTWNDQNSAFVPLQTVGSKLFTGHATDTVLTSNFSSIIYGGGATGTDDTHPGTKGHKYYGEFVNRTRRSLPL